MVTCSAPFSNLALGSFLAGCSDLTILGSFPTTSSNLLTVVALVVGLVTGSVADSASVGGSTLSAVALTGKSILTGSSSTKRETGGGPRSGDSTSSAASEHMARISSRLERAICVRIHSGHD